MSTQYRGKTFTSSDLQAKLNNNAGIGYEVMGLTSDLLTFNFVGIGNAPAYVGESFSSKEELETILNNNSAEGYQLDKLAVGSVVLKNTNQTNVQYKVFDRTGSTGPVVFCDSQLNPEYDNGFTLIAIADPFFVMSKTV